MSDKTYLDLPLLDDSHRALESDLDAWCAANLKVDHSDTDAACRALVRQLGAAGWLRYYGQPHPHIYLAFGHLPLPVVAAGGSDVHTAELNGQVAFASWLYHVGDLAVNVMYALPGERRDGLKVAWHPRMGAKRLRFSRFGD
ncbi:hypothetical protein AWV80_34150 [Cupriavidus sp. UYMU48A]|nr:hypothetical protein AWV80_34150 [Cupriavidus sp. UYMU48A]